MCRVDCKALGVGQCGKFVFVQPRYWVAILMLSIYLLLNFRNLGCAISEFSGQWSLGFQDRLFSGDGLV